MPHPVMAATLLFAAAQLIALPPGNVLAEQSSSVPGSPPLNGIAHVAIRVQDLSRSRAFYHELGFEEAFTLDKEGTPTEVFLKINDTQFIELYPKRQDDETTGFLHVCFESKEIGRLNAFYQSRGLRPTAVQRAGAGNLLFTMRGPEEQNIEFTQYMPGSRHTLDIGKHLGVNRISDRILGVGLQMTEVNAAAEYYANGMGFPASKERVAARIFRLPGTSAEQIAITPKTDTRARLVLGVKSLKTAAKVAEERGIAPLRRKNILTLHDPDGNEIQLRALPAKPE